MKWISPRVPMTLGSRAKTNHEILRIQLSKTGALIFMRRSGLLDLADGSVF